MRNSLLPRISRTVYEQFLGKVKRLTDVTAPLSRQAGSQKSGGVFYTPTLYRRITSPRTRSADSSTVETRRVRELRILYPASAPLFLIGAY
jgi:hypothetical protein